MKSDIAHQLLLKLYLQIPGLIHHLVDVELDKFLAGACVNGNVDMLLLTFVQFLVKRGQNF
jgi:hypothetical protein